MSTRHRVPAIAQVSRFRVTCQGKVIDAAGVLGADIVLRKNIRDNSDVQRRKFKCPS